MKPHPSTIQRFLEMLKDPIIEEIHRIRDEWAASFQYDLRALCKDIKRQEKRDFLTDEHGNFIKDEKGGLILKPECTNESQPNPKTG